MALFTDGPASTIEDLAAQDSQILDVASVEGIDLTRKLVAGAGGGGYGPGSSAGAADADDCRVLRMWAWHAGSYRLENIVVTPALRMWHTYRTLEMAYGDAYYNQLNDRYAKKRDQFGKLGRWAYERLILTGIGITPRPVPRAPTPDVEAAAGAVPDGTYYATMAWTNAAGEEGASAIPNAITTTGSGFAGDGRAPGQAGGRAGVERLRRRGAGCDDAAEQRTDRGRHGVDAIERIDDGR